MSAAVAHPAEFKLDQRRKNYFLKDERPASPTSPSRSFSPTHLETRVTSDAHLSEESGESETETLQKNAEMKKIRKDKLAFVIGVVHFWICAYWLGSYPSTFYKFYTVEALILLPLRWKAFKKMKMHYYMFDFCYGANVLLLVYLWCFPKSTYLFKVLFAYNSGTLAWSIVLFKNSLVYHRLHEVTSLFIHWSPMLVSWSMRWYPDCSLLSCQPPSSPSSPSLLTAKASEMILWPMIPYLIWAVMYYLKIFVISSKRIRDRGYHTLYKYMTEESNFGLLRTIVFSFSPRWQPFVYMIIHLLLVWISLLTAIIWWNSFSAHTIWIAVATLFSAWNGAAHYFQ